MSYLRILFRNVYSQQYELSDRSTGNGTERERNHSGSLFREDQTGKTCGHAGYGNVPEEYPPKRHYDKRRYLKRAHRGYGSGLFNQQYASSAGYCP